MESSLLRQAVYLQLELQRRERKNAKLRKSFACPGAYCQLMFCHLPDDGVRCMGVLMVFDRIVVESGGLMIVKLIIFVWLDGISENLFYWVSLIFLFFFYPDERFLF